MSVCDRRPTLPQTTAERATRSGTQRECRKNNEANCKSTTVGVSLGRKPYIPRAVISSNGVIVVSRIYKEGGNTGLHVLFKGPTGTEKK